jgi:hypothetical protein
MFIFDLAISYRQSVADLCNLQVLLFVTDAGCWSLVIGSRSLVTGYWLQVAGHRMPDIRGRIIDF